MYLTKIFSGCTSLRYINIIEKNNCGEYSLFEYNNKCYENCPLRTYKKGYICHDCFTSCESCEQGGAEQSHNCSSCKNEYNLIYHIGNNNLNCYENIYDKNLTYNVHISECSTGFELFSRLLFCLDDCYKNNSINECLEIYNNFKYYFNNECLNEISTSIFEDKNYNYSCIINNVTNNICLFDDEYTFKKETIFYRILNNFDNIKNIYINFNEDNYTIFEDEEYNYKYTITTNKNKQYKNDFNNINYTECKKNILKNMSYQMRIVSIY